MKFATHISPLLSSYQYNRKHKLDAFLLLQPCHFPAMISLLVLLQLTGKMDVDGVEKLKGVEVIAYKSLASTQVDDETTLTPPTPQDVAIIM